MAQDEKRRGFTSIEDAIRNLQKGRARDNDEAHRTCSQCHQSKKLTAFVKDYRKQGGYRAVCKACHNQNNKKYNEQAKQRRKQHGLK